MDNRLSGNTVDICPVGALLDKSFLFKQRVWFLKSVDTICPGCSAGCNIRADYNNERIYRLVPRENPDVNEYWMCDDGRHGWGYVHADDRLLFPMLGRGEEQELALWEVALKATRAGFERVRSEYGDGAVAGIASAHLTNEEHYLFGTLFSNGLAGGPVAVHTRLSDEGDVAFKGGFTIRGDKSPNTRGARTVLEGLGLSIRRGLRNLARRGGRADTGSLPAGRRSPGFVVRRGTDGPGSPRLSGGSGHPGPRLDGDGRRGPARRGVYREGRYVYERRRTGTTYTAGPRPQLATLGPTGKSCGMSTGRWAWMPHTTGLKRL